MKTAEKLKLLERTISFYEKAFINVKEGKAILKKHGVTDAGIYTRHRIGFADGSLLKALPSSGKVIDDLKETGLLTEDGKEYFQDCVIFPLMDKENKVVNIVGYDGKYKYLFDSPNTWNVSITNTYPEVFSTENIMDALSLEMAGINNVVCGDSKGIKLTLKANEHLLKYGSDSLKQAIESTPADSNEQEGIEDGFKVKCGLRSYVVIGLENSSRKLKATVKAEKSGKKHFDTVNFYSAKERRQLIQDLTLAFDELPEVIQNDMERIVKECEEYSKQDLSSNYLSSSISNDEKAKAIEFGRSENLIEQILSDYDLCGFVGEDEKWNKLLCYLCATSRLMERGNVLSTIILSSSGAGKSKLMDTTLSFMPPEDVIKLTNLSSKAIYYKEKDSLKNKILAIEESCGFSNEANYAIRSLISSGQLTSEVAMRDSSTGKLTTQQNTIDAGSTSVFFTTTDSDQNNETVSRFFQVSINENEEQTKRIIERHMNERTLEGLKAGVKKEKTLRTHRNFQRLLKNYKVITPYRIKFTDSTLKARRLYPQILNLISAVSFLRQMTKKAKTERIDNQAITYIEVDETDIKIGIDLANHVLGKCSDELSAPALNLLQKIDSLLDTKQEALKKENLDSDLSKSLMTFTRKELRYKFGINSTTLHKNLHELIKLEYVALESGKRNTLQQYKLLYNADGKIINGENIEELLTVEKI